MKALCICLLLAVAWPAASGAEGVAYLIRHGEKAEGDDPALTEAGRDRSQRWARLLADSGLSIVITSTAKRTRETGAIIAAALDLPTEAFEPSDAAGISDLLSFDYEDQAVLIVGHTETLGAIMVALGATDVPELSQSDFDRLFILPSGQAAPFSLRMP